LQRYKKYLNIATFFAIILLQSAKFFRQNFRLVTPDFYEAFQHFFRGFPKSVGWLRSKKYIGLRERL